MRKTYEFRECVLCVWNMTRSLLGSKRGRTGQKFHESKDKLCLLNVGVTAMSRHHTWPSSHFSIRISWTSVSQVLLEALPAIQLWRPPNLPVELQCVFIKQCGCSAHQMHVDSAIRINTCGLEKASAVPLQLLSHCKHRRVCDSLSLYIS